MKRFLFFLFSVTTLYAKSSIHTGEPWLTGPLLTPTSNVIPKGHWTTQPYVFYLVNYNRFDQHGKTVSSPKLIQWIFQLPTRIGLTENLDFSITPQAVFARSEGASNWSFSDLPIGFDYQLYRGDENSFLTRIKFSLIESLPTGRFNGLDFDDEGTDVGGNGSFGTNVGLTFGRLKHYGGHHYLSLRLGTYLVIPSQVRVKGVNYYGGDPGTKGVVDPGLEGRILFGAEYTLTKNWALAIDIAAILKNKNRFKGKTTLPVGNPSLTNFSVAPALEYNWSPSMGVIIGSWFSVAGRNSSNFVSFVAAYNYVY